MSTTAIASNGGSFTPRSELNCSYAELRIRRHTFGTRMAAAGVPMRLLQEWMAHRDFKTTLIYADYAPAANEADLVM